MIYREPYVDQWLTSNRETKLLTKIVKNWPRWIGRLSSLNLSSNSMRIQKTYLQETGIRMRYVASCIDLWLRSNMETQLLTKMLKIHIEKFSLGCGPHPSTDKECGAWLWPEREKFLCAIFTIFDNSLFPSTTAPYKPLRTSFDSPSRRYICSAFA